MDGMADKISEILSDPDSMDKIKMLADSIFGKSESTAEKTSAPTDLSQNDGDPPFSLPDGLDISKIMGLMSALNTKQTDSRAGLLMALKPHLSPERRERVDKAVKFLKIAAILPVLREQGLLDIF